MNFFSIIANIFSLETLLFLVLGTLAGIFVGALPGLTPTLAIALLIPVTYGLGPVPALVMLMAIYTAGIYGGSIAAILLHTPGTPSAAATADDGYALTQKGRGLEALGISTLSSMIGGLLSGFALLLIAPPLARLSLKFGAPEYLCLSIFGLTIIGSLSKGKFLKGILCALVGLGLATVGTHVSTGYPKFIFKNTYFMTGIPLVASMVGLFSLSEVMKQSEKIKQKKEQCSINSEKVSLKGKMFPNKKGLFKLIPSFIRSSIIGVLIGILPGASADIGAWVSYNEAKRWSKNKEEFGKGSIEGICAPETANNAVTGGAVIPLLTLGIPGSTTAAVLLGGLQLHGMIPGSQLFTKYATTTYSIIFGFILANIVMGLIGFLIAPRVSKVAKIPTSILSPIIIILAVVGCYSMNSRIEDVFVMAVFGIVGYILRKTDIPTAPMILALILGSQVEVNLYQSKLMAKGVPYLKFMLGRPICVIFMTLIAVALLTPLFSTIKEKIKQTKEKINE